MMNPRIRQTIWLVLACLTLALVWLRLSDLAETADENRRAAESALQSVDILADQVEDLGAIPRVDPSDLPQPGTGPQGIPGLAGPAGPQGPTGPVGPVGPRGPIGNRGLQGLIGDEGPTGATGATGATGPQGERGATGPAGPMGEPGPAGEQGPAGPAGADGKDGTDGKDGQSALPFTFSFVVQTNPAQSTTYTVACQVDGCTVTTDQQ